MNTESNKQPLPRSPAFRAQGEFPRHNPNPVMKFSPTGNLQWFNLAAHDAASAAGWERPSKLIGGKEKLLIAKALQDPEAVISGDTAAGERHWRWSFVVEPADGQVYCYGQDITDLVQCKLQLLDSAEDGKPSRGSGMFRRAVKRLDEAARYADGYKIVAVSDSKGAIHDPEGLDIPSVIQRKNEASKLEAVYCKGSVCETIQSGRITNAELLELNVDILIPAALEGVITAENAGDIKAHTILELANGPTDDAADAILAERGCTVIPDILANAGGVTVSYYEWVQNRTGESWSKARVHEALDSRMAEQFGEVQSLAGDNKIPLRTAAYALALRRIGETVDALGTSRYYANGQPEA